jgi:hypothetical protein
MLKDKVGYRKETASGLTAYISKTRNREDTTFYEASICDDEKAEIIAELAGYSRGELLKEVRKNYPGIKIENA